MFEQAEGTAQKIAGQVQKAFGSATGDIGNQAAGRARQAAGSAQEAYGEVLDQVRKSAVANPVLTVVVVAGLALALGALLSKR